MLLALVAQRRTATNVALAAAAPRGVDARILSPEQAASLLHPGAVALGRLDVTDGLDGVEDGLWALGSLAARGVRVLNRAGALLAAHDKLLTAKVLQRSGLPHPRTRVLHPGDPVPDWDGPLVVKPRFGSWGRDVERCDDEIAFRRHLRLLEHRLWFQRHGALLQELVSPAGADLRVVVAGGVAVGAISRIAAPGEWRTNISLGGTRVPVEPPPAALELALRAAAALGGAELLGVDLLPDGAGGWTVLELNGAVDLTREYRLDRDPFVAAMAELVRVAAHDREALSPEQLPLAATGSDGAP
ncbi:MAG: ATP-grasp domain-containing protein [Gaiellaceae bacterium]